MIPVNGFYFIMRIVNNKGLTKTIAIHLTATKNCTNEGGSKT